MLELVRTTVLAGLGAGVITRDRADEVVSRLVEEGKVTAEEAKRLVSDLLDSGSQQWEEVQAGLGNSLSQALDSLDLPQKKEVAGLALRLEKAEERIAMIESRLDQLRDAGVPGPNSGSPPPDLSIDR